MNQRVELIAPGHVPDALGGSYEDACKALDLDPLPGGYALYLINPGIHRATLITTDTEPVRAVLQGRDGYVAADMDAVREAMSSDGAFGLYPGWPEELGGGPRCQFCHDPYPAWIYEGADVDVLLGEPLTEDAEPPVLGTDVVGCIDWLVCDPCHGLIEERTPGAWRELLDRYDGDHVPMQVQAAWREFWGNHRRPKLAPPPEWTPGRRRLLANTIRSNWDGFTAQHPIDNDTVTNDPDEPAPAVLDTVLAAAHNYLNEPPAAGRVRRYPSRDGSYAIIRADGDDWSLIGATKEPVVAYVVADEVPDTVLTVSGAKTARLLRGLSEIAP